MTKKATKATLYPHLHGNFQNFNGKINNSVAFVALTRRNTS